jgi:hypothetical protein
MQNTLTSAIFPLISVSDVGNIKELSDTENYGQCDIKHIMTLPINTRMSVFKISTYIMTNGLAVILAIMSFLTFIAAVILYITLVIVKEKIFMKTEKHFLVFVYICLSRSLL